LGIGRMLYAAMEVLLKAQNVTNMYVLVAGVETEDEYLTHDSQKFHLAMGYDYVGKLHKAGYKFGHWYDMITMEKLIAPHPEYTQPEVVTWQELDEEIFALAGVTK
jgi:phosphinothricin acetyltransferase